MTALPCSSLRAEGARRYADHWIGRGRDICESDSLRNNYDRIIASIRAHTDLLSRRTWQDSNSGLDPISLPLAAFYLATEQPSWHREPETFRRTGSTSLYRQWHAFAAHVLEAFPCPRFLSTSWLSMMSRDWWRSMHLHLAAGRSWRDFEMPDGSMGDRPTGRYLNDAPDDATPPQALRWAQVLAASRRANVRPDSKLARWLMKAIPVTDDAEHEAFWKDSLKFFVRHALSIECLKETVTTIRSLRFEPGKKMILGAAFDHPLDPELRIGSSTPRQVARLVTNWEMIYRERYRDRITPVSPGDMPWHQISVDRVQFDSNTNGQEKWEIVPLLTPNELRIEGSILNHCVATYCDDCRYGSTSIWSLRQRSEKKMRRRVTLEVRPSSRQIWMAKGKSNRDANEWESELIRRWADDQRLTVAKHVRLVTTNQGQNERTIPS